MREENEKKNKTKQTNKQANKKKKNFCNNDKMKWHEYLTMDRKPKKVASM